MEQQQQTQMLYDSQGQIPYMTDTYTPYLDDSSEWAQAHSGQAGLEYFHPYPVAPPEVHQSIEGMASSSSYASSSQMASQSSYGQMGLVAPSDSRMSRSPSPHPSDLHSYGTLNADQRTWRCAYPGCNSKAVFIRPCDLRKHFHRHSKNYFCRHEGCPQATSGGFSSRKDRLRHEQKHNPGIECEWEGCERIFSRADNMKDHLKRIHRKGA